MRTRWGRLLWRRSPGHAPRHPALASVATLATLLMLVPFLGSAPAGAAALVPRITNQPNMVDVALDNAGNLYESRSNGDVNVWPVQSGTVFGQSVIYGQPNRLVKLHDTPGLALDTNGDLFISDDDGAGDGSISVLAASTGTIFGQSVTANTLTPIVTGLDAPVGLAFDSSGNLYYATANDINVLPVATGTLYGQSVTADTPAALVSGLVDGSYLALDSASSPDLFYTDAGGGADASVNVLPGDNSTSIFGQPVTADTASVLVSDLPDAAGLATDAAGNLYVDYDSVVGVLSNSSGSLDGTAITADTLTPIAVGLLGDLGSTFYSGNLYVADQTLGSIDELTAPNAVITSVAIGGSEANPIVTVSGSGFTTSPPTYAPSEVCPDAAPTGEDYDYGNLYLNDNSASPWGAGLPGDCIGLTAAAVTGTKMVFGLGSFYAAGSGSAQLNAGDPFTVGVDGTTFSGTVTYTSPSSATVTKVKGKNGPGGGGSTVTIRGTGLSTTKYVFFGDVPATKVTVLSSTKVTAVAPPGSGTVVVEPVTNSGLVGSSSASYTYVPPALSTLSPVKGPTRGGTTVTITGTDLTGTSGVEFGSAPAASFLVVSDTEVQAVTPAESAGNVSVSVTTPAGTSNGLNFRFK